MGLDFRKPRDRAIILQNTAGQGGGSPSDIRLNEDGTPRLSEDGSQRLKEN